MALALRFRILFVHVAVPLCCLFLHADGWQYGIVIDAGSSGTRFHAFRWPDRVADPLHPQYPALTIPEEMFSVAVKPGISAFAGNASALEPYLNKLLELGQERLMFLRELWYLVPVYLKATAGARDLFQDQRDEIFAKVRAVLYSCPFRFDTDYWARTISGEEEGVYAWISVNAIKGTYRSPNKKDTWGSLDMGGSSTQVAFIPHDVSIIQNFFPLHLSYLSMHLYAHSYLEFGYRDANQRVVRRYLKPSAGTKDNPIRNPCYPAGNAFLQPLQEPFAYGQAPVWVLGTGNFEQCYELALSLLNLNRTCFVPARSRNFTRNPSGDGACAIAGTYEPRLWKRKFVAMGHYAKIAKVMGLPMGEAFNFSEFFEGTKRLCAAPLNALESDEEYNDPGVLNMGAVPPGDLRKLDPMYWSISRCWKAVWFWVVLHHGFRFPADSRQIVFAEKLERFEIGWALGSLAYDVNYYPWEGVRGFGGPLVASAPSAAGPATAEAASGRLLAGGTAFGLLLGAALGALWGRRATARSKSGYLAMTS